jgi:hypothetical protein
MPPHYSPELIAKMIEALPRNLSNCSEIAEALIETNLPFTHRYSWSMILGGTQYDQSRAQMLTTIQLIINELPSLHDDGLRPTLIRVTAKLKEVAKQCRWCPRTNRENLAQGKPFVCRATELLNTRPQSKNRFRLNKKGQIIESR